VGVPGLVRGGGAREVTRRHIPEDGILHSHRRESLKSYLFICGLFNDTVGSSEFIALNGTFISERRNRRKRKEMIMP
jgi:hypothetical protein